MAFQARHRWMIGRIKDCLGLKDESLVEESLKDGNTMKDIDTFLSENGPTSIFFYHQIIEPTDNFGLSNQNQPREQTNDDRDRAGSILKRFSVLKPKPTETDQNADTYSAPTDDGEAINQVGTLGLFLTDGVSIPLRGRGVYFFRTDPGKSLDPSAADDNEISFGSLNKDLLAELNSQLNSIYKPLIDAKPNSSWMHATSADVRTFNTQVEKFKESITDGMKSLSAGLELKKPTNEMLDSNSPFGMDMNSDLLPEFVELLHSWCVEVETYLEEDEAGQVQNNDGTSNRKSKNQEDQGPNTELEYWRRRMQRLTSITEQLKSRECRGVISVLTSVTKSAVSVGNTNEIYSLLRRWRQIDINITEAANEAKDNVKYLSTLEKFIGPLYDGTPETIIETLPALLNSIKMIHTIARYYNTTERMTCLFMKISNQMIINCKRYIVTEKGDDVETIWDRNIDQLLQSFEVCLRLNESYQEQYHMTKDKLLSMPKGRQFDFSEPQIFGRFDLFCRRLLKLIDLFSTIRQFKSLGNHGLEGIGTLVEGFFDIIKNLRSKKHHLLDYADAFFDRDFVQFNVRVNDLEHSLQQFINRSFESITSIEGSLTLLKKFQTILQRNSLKSDLDSKFMVIFHNYGLDLSTVQELYEKHKHNPPVNRNAPPVAGNILWARNLLKRIEEPMRKFETNHDILNTKDAKKIIKSYNKVARTLVAFEYLWYEAWCSSIQSAKAGLQATLIIRHPKTKKLYVNFDPEILQLIREAKFLSRMSIELPSDAQLVLFQEEKFKKYHDELRYILSEYDRIVGSIAPIARELLKPHIKDLELQLRPGMITLTWTSLNIDAYKQSVLAGLLRFEELVANINDIIENRIEKNLKQVGRILLVELPSNGIITLEEFVQIQENFVRKQTNILRAKNVEIETSVQDLIDVVMKYPFSSDNIKSDRDKRPNSPTSEAGGVNLEEVESVVEHYNKMMYQALLQATKKSLNAIKKRVCSKGATGFLFLDKPFFEVDVQLSVPSVRLVPSLDEVQYAINKAAQSVLWCTKTVWDWGQQHIPDDISSPKTETETGIEDTMKKISFYDRVGKDKQIVRSVLLLTGALLGTKNQVKDYLSKFSIYDWLWKDDMELTYKRFISKNPTIQDFEAELSRFVDLENEIKQVVSVYNIGALSLNTSNLKLQLRAEASQWKVKYSDKVHQQASDATNEILEYIAYMQQRVGKEVSSLESLRYVMNVLKEVRERESSIEMEISPIIDMYDMLDHYLPTGVISKEEMDKKSIIRSSWRKLVDYTEIITDQLAEVQGKFKAQLTRDIKDFVVDVKALRSNWSVNGPMVPGLRPKDAVERLRRFRSEYEVRERKQEIYASGEELFSLKRTEFPELTKMEKELKLLDMLYELYIAVNDTMELYRNKSWSECVSTVNDMSQKVSEFEANCKRLPLKLREWDAYRDLKNDIDDFQAILPLLLELSKPSIKPRHWVEFTKITGIKFNPDSGKLKDLWTPEILLVTAEIEEICQGADKQLEIEAKLTSIKEKWAAEEFSFTRWRERECYVLKGFAQVIDDLEDSQMACQTMISMRHVEPFYSEISNVLASLSNATETLERWSKVQMLWISLESVFTGGDIAKQMPTDAKKFARVDKDFCRIMEKASETKNVISCCMNEILRNTLPILHTELERCQKSLEGYLEQKRAKFPRFYFVSNPVLLQILSQGSDVMSVQPYYEKIFDSINQVVHLESDTKMITHFKQLDGTDEEIVEFSKPVKATGNIEDWLLLIEKEMKITMKNVCRSSSADYPADNKVESLKAFLDSFPAQFALLGFQFAWTANVTDALSRCMQSKSVMNDMNKSQLATLTALSSWCLEDISSKMIRKKIETLVTIQVHQRDVFSELFRLFKDRKITDSNDFEWLKQARFYWQPEGKDDIESPGTCIISVCDVDFNYSYEYLGCKERLVITPLTDRCYITLTQALGMKLGGAPAGPAGTGKTETVKDLGRALGIYVVVTNCTDQQRFTDMAKIFKGLCQAGLWGCFDEFNRIELPVLSVVAQQVLAITNAKRALSKSFIFPGDSQNIELQHSVGYFITMNPGYAGRQELPENLKVLFRSVAMMVPNREIIMRVKLCSCGYTKFTELAKKFNTLYKCCEEQLSKQKHYDFGLRNILSVLRTAGQTKRDNRDRDEQVLIMQTLRDMNLSKFVAQDVPLFLSLLGDLFPDFAENASVSTSPVSKQEGDFDHSVNIALKALGFQKHPSWIRKLTQVHDTVKVRHGVMLVGPAGGGKSALLETLVDSLSLATGTPNRLVKMNPKAIRAEEMFGETDTLSGEWVDGIFAAMWSKYNDRTRKDNTWIVCDGPVDAIWIENLNTVLDDNKILTLANGDRIPMTENVKLFFEVENLDNASPATVSRAGIIYVSDSDLDWSPVLESWLSERPEAQVPILRDLFQRFLVQGKLKKRTKPKAENPKKPKSSQGKRDTKSASSKKLVIDEKKSTEPKSRESQKSAEKDEEDTDAIGEGFFEFCTKDLSPVMNASRVNLVSSCFTLMEGILEDAVLSHSPSDLEGELEKVFLFCFVWTFGGLLESEDRVKLDSWLRDRSDEMPKASKETVYEFWIDVKKMEWINWQPPKWKVEEEVDTIIKETGRLSADYLSLKFAHGFSSLLVPTIDSARSLYILDLITPKRSALIVGSPGTAKSSIIQMFLDTFDPSCRSVKKVNFSYATTPSIFQETLEGEFDKRGGKTFGPPGGRKMTFFLDDLSMPEMNAWGDQPTLELVRQVIETNTMAYLDKDKRGNLKIIEDVTYVAAMNYPVRTSSKKMKFGKDDGQDGIPNRLKRHFFTFNMTTPETKSINDIFGQMMRIYFDKEPKLLEMAEKIVKGTINIWNKTKNSFMPTPSKFHYIFSMREISRVFQGVLRVPIDIISPASEKNGKASGAKNSETVVLQAWRHELDRVFADKLISIEDKEKFSKIVDDVLNRQFGKGIAAGLYYPNEGAAPGKKGSTANAAKEIEALSDNQMLLAAMAPTKAKEPICFCDFMRDDEYDEDGVLVREAPKIYEPVNSLEVLLDRVQLRLSEYNEANSGKGLDIILFRDALRHLVRITRILGSPRGSGLLVGVGGSGRQSLTKLATFILKHKLFQLKLTKQYNIQSLLEDFRVLFKLAGKEAQQVTFLMTEAEIRDEAFLEVFNSFLLSGQVPGLFPKDELVAMAADLRTLAQKQIYGFVDTPENLTKFLIDTVRSNFHVILCMSPMNKQFPERARKFPGIISGTYIDWFLPWPQQALVAVARKNLNNEFNLACENKVKEQLIQHMGNVHATVVLKCQQYLSKMRRHVYQTPKSFLSFLDQFKSLYTEKLSGILDKEERIVLGLKKLVKGAEDVESMKVDLAKEEVKLQEAEKACNEMLSSLEVSSLEAKKEAGKVEKIKSACEAEAEQINLEKQSASEDLAAAQPYVDEATNAAESIKSSDLNEMKKLPRAGDIIKLTFDGVMILRKFKLDKVKKNKVTLGIGKEKAEMEFIQDSYSLCQKNMLSDSGFLKSLLNFSKYDKDHINEETIELLLPYIELDNFNPVVAKNASKACEGLCAWVIAMVKYHAASKMVKPKLEKLALAESKLADAMKKLTTAEKALKKCKDTLEVLQNSFQSQMEEKAKVEEGALRTKRKMDQATALIDGLKDERIRWTDDAKTFAETKLKLAGDSAMAAAFISYCGPFDQKFREEIVYDDLCADLKSRKVPVTCDPDLDLVEFLVDIPTSSEWSMQGLPTDILSMQNGILLTRTVLFTLLIDPQGQGLQWIENKEKDKLPEFGTTTISNSKLRDQLEYCMSEGKALIIKEIDDDGVDPVLIPVLEKQIVSKGRSKYIALGEKACEVHDDFVIYLVSSLPNPHLTPEVQAMVTTINFTVTQAGLEDQLLGRVIRKEQKAMEDQLSEVMESVTLNTRALVLLNDQLLKRLTENTGNLLDDVELISVLANTKRAATEVNEKLHVAGETKKSINEKREQYRSVATRGSLLYFSIVDLSLVNPMYQTSLDQFMGLFLGSMDNAERSSISIIRRIGNIIDYMTYSVYKYICRGLYEQDKLAFLVVILMKILISAEKLGPECVRLLLRAGAELDINEVEEKPFEWLPNSAYLNLIQLTKELKIFSNLRDQMVRSETSWRQWYDDNQPELKKVPDIEHVFHGEAGHFYRALLVRCLREDRTILAINELIRNVEYIEYKGITEPGLGEKYTVPITETVETIYKDMNASTPAVYLLSAGADPTENIEQFCRKRKQAIVCVSMGEGQGVVAQKAIIHAASEGSCVLLQNAHLGLEFISQLCHMLDSMHSTKSQNVNADNIDTSDESKVHPDFRLFITTEPISSFPIPLLQRSVKVTNEPPKGLKAGLHHSFTVTVDQDRLDRVDTGQWRILVYVLCFMHSIVQERRKFGPLGWVIPYEFNTSDLQASLYFLEKHLYSTSISWTTIQYMISEVQYGGRITDDLDRRLFNTFAEEWIKVSVMQGNFSFNPEQAVGRIPRDFTYNIPEHTDVESYIESVSKFPQVDSPELFGLHPNADMTFRVKEANSLLRTLIETQPKNSAELVGGKSKIEIVEEKAIEFIEKLPADFVQEVYESQIDVMGGLGVPLNIFLMQEIALMQNVITKTRSDLATLKQAIKGEVVMTTSLEALSDALFLAEVPSAWIFSMGGDEISWQCSTIGLWFSSLSDRVKQLGSWIEDGRPTCYWMTGFFNAQGFLTAMKQEVTRHHKSDGWALDSILYHAEVTSFEQAHQVRSAPKEGCYVNGLYLEGCQWDKDEATLSESAPKVLFSALPVLFVTAVTKAQKRGKEAGPYGPYECPVYKYPNRRDLIFYVSLPTRNNRPAHWILRGTALLLSTEST